MIMRKIYRNMDVMIKYFFYLTKIINIILLILLYIGFGWGFPINVIHIIGSLLFILILFYPKNISNTSSLLKRLLSYLLLIICFFPRTLYDNHDLFSFENLVFCYAILLILLDLLKTSQTI